MDIADQKKQMRAVLRARRDKAHSQNQNAHENLTERFLETGLGHEGQIVAGYFPIHSEINVLALMEASPARTALPFIEKKNAPLRFRLWAVGDPVANGPFGTQHPPESHASVRPDVVVVPLLGFTLCGHRLGYGGGFYDRTLQQLRAEGDVVAVGVGYAEQKEDSLPVDVFDQLLDWVITPDYALEVTV